MHQILEFKKEVLDKLILRQCIMPDGVAEEPMPRSAFGEILRATALGSGCASNVTVHGIRWGLGSKVSKIYPEAERSQHLT